MSKIGLRDYQKSAIERMQNGCILCGGVGSGKSRTALGYYYVQNGGDIDSDEYVPMDDNDVKDLYVITTARKRDTKEWEADMIPFLLSTNKDVNLYSNKVIVDSWNNIKKYENIKNAFFIFDEQRVVGSGTWVKAFLKITKDNEWILLSATPGDTWQDYIPVFIANGFYKNRTEFTREHIIYKRFSKFPQIDRYINTGRLIRLRNKILINMVFVGKQYHIMKIYIQSMIFRHTRILCVIVGTHIRINRWKPRAELCYLLRRIVNSDDSRQVAVCELFEKHPKLIIFYNFDYELEILKEISYGDDVEIAEWNGHKHQPIPESTRWVYLVQYNAGCEGWNCVKTDTIIFYSQNYSYKVMAQAAGRTDRLNTPFSDLYYYHLKSRSGIDLAISKALDSKKKFNELRNVKWK